MNNPSHPSRTDEQWIQDYLGGRLSDAEAEDFETRCLADDALGRELEQALEIRAALKPHPVGQFDTAHQTQPDARARKRRTMLPLAAAASAVLAVFSLYWLRTPDPPEPVFRGSEQHLALQVDIEGGVLQASWDAVPGAAGYELLVFDNNGDALASVSTEVLHATITLEHVNRSTRAASVEVAALDDVGQTLMRSRRIDLPAAQAARD